MNNALARHDRKTTQPPASFFAAVCRHWLLWVNLLIGIWVLLPWLAPILMHVGATGPASIIYLAYAPQCHQLPQRSYFLFGPQPMIPLVDILAVYPTDDPLKLRPFLGTPELGWKVAWSDRMVSLYTPIFIVGVLYGLSGKRWRPARWRKGLLLPFVPLLLDGGSHLVNDLLGLRFRDTNDWLAVLTNNAFDPTFYPGDALGSFNWWMRLLTGLLAGVAVSWLVFPYLNKGFVLMAQSLPENSGSRTA